MTFDPLDIRSYDYDLPDELIASAPAQRRSSSRLLVVDPVAGRLSDRVFSDVIDLLEPGDLLVVNDARVSPARLTAHRDSGGRVEVFVVGFEAEGRWHGEGLTALTRSNRVVAIGEEIQVDGHAARLRLEHRDGAGITHWAIVGDADPWVLLDTAGEVPLPPYIVRRRRDAGEAESTPEDRERYQTVYARTPGAVAAPTAGLHFDTELLGRLEQRGIERASVTLLVGIGTFRPVDSDRLDAHELHAEQIEVPQSTIDAVARTRARGGRVIAVGTTVVRALEAAAASGELRAGRSATSLFIYPGYRFAVVDALITNFHLPRSSLLALVSSLAGLELTRDAYAHAVRERYRFYSYGDAMFITGAALPGTT